MNKEKIDILKERSEELRRIVRSNWRPEIDPTAILSSACAMEEIVDGKLTDAVTYIMASIGIDPLVGGTQLEFILETLAKD